MKSMLAIALVLFSLSAVAAPTLPCEAKTLKKNIEVTLEPEIHGCEECTTRRSDLVKKAGAQKLRLGVEGDGSETFSKSLVELNDEIRSIPAFLFFSIVSPSLDEATQLSFGLGQRPRFGQLLEPALKSVALSKAVPAEDRKSIDAFFTLAANPKVLPRTKEMELKKISPTLEKNLSYVSDIARAMVPEFVKLAEGKAVKAAYDVPDLTSLKNLAKNPDNEKLAKQVEDELIIKWRDDGIAQAGLQFVCDGKDDGKPIHLSFGLNHARGVHAILSPIFRNLRIVTMVVDRTVQSCAEYKDAKKEGVKEIEDFEAFLTRL